MVRFSKYVGSVQIELILLKPENKKHCNKIIFKCVNSAVGPIFNIFFWIKWLLVLWTVHFVSCTVNPCAWTVQLLFIRAKKKKKKWNSKCRRVMSPIQMARCHVNFFNGSCRLSLQIHLKPNFVNFLKWTINKCLKSNH